MTRSSTASDSPEDSSQFLFLGDMAAKAEFPFDYDLFPAAEDTAAWMEINSPVFDTLRVHMPIQSVEFTRVWLEAQALLLGLLCRKAHAVPFLQDIELLVCASRRLPAELEGTISGDIYWVHSSVSEDNLMNLLHRLHDQIADFRRQQLQHFEPSYGDGHPIRKISGRNGQAGPGARLRPVGSADVSCVDHVPSTLVMAFQQLMTDALEVREHFNGDFLQLERASLCLKRTFYRFADELSSPELHDCWNSWLTTQAWLFWRYKNAPCSQSEEDIHGDFMQAKRYLGYLIADDMLGRALRSDGCVRHLLSAERVYYLVTLTVEEFLRTKAYFHYLARARRTREEEHESRDKEDYAVAEEFVYDTLLMLCDVTWEKRCVTCGGDFSRIFRAVLPAKDIAGSIGYIQKAKLHGLERLSMLRDVRPLVDKCVEALYGWLDAGAEDRVPTGAVRELCRHFGCMNMFELLMMCPVARRSHGEFRKLLPEGARRRRIGLPDGRSILAGGS